MRSLSQHQLLGIDLLLDRFPDLQVLSEDILEKEVIVKEVVLEVAKVGQESGFKLIFSGGTSLSQGWGTIERISEDVDFRVITPEFPSKNAKFKALSGLKSELDQSLRRAGFDIEGEIVGRDSNRYIRAEVIYDSAFARDTPSIRPHIQVELMGADRPFRTEQRTVQDILERHGVTVSTPSPAIPMVSLADIVSDKVISYLRRTAEHRANPELAYRYDPRLVRHLYDVHCIVQSDLNVIGEATPVFAYTLTQEIEQYGGQRFPAFKERPVEVLRGELALLANDPEARRNYEVFVNDLVYGSKPSFDEVSQTFHKVATGFLIAGEISLAAQVTSFANPGAFSRGFGKHL